MHRPFLLLLLVVPAIAAADEFCTAQTQALLARMASGLTPAPSATQLTQMREIARKFCEDQAEAALSPVPPSGYDCWFSNHMVNGQAEKDGNKRLRNLKR